MSGAGFKLPDTGGSGAHAATDGGLRGIQRNAVQRPATSTKGALQTRDDCLPADPSAPVGASGRTSGSMLTSRTAFSLQFLRGVVHPRFAEELTWQIETVHGEVDSDRSQVPTGILLHGGPIPLCIAGSHALESAIAEQLTLHPNLIGNSKWYIVIKTGHLRYVQQNTTTKIPCVTSMASHFFQTIVLMLKKVEDNSEMFVRAIEVGIL